MHAAITGRPRTESYRGVSIEDFTWNTAAGLDAFEACDEADTMKDVMTIKGRARSISSVFSSRPIPEDVDGILNDLSCACAETSSADEGASRWNRLSALSSGGTPHNSPDSEAPSLLSTSSGLSSPSSEGLSYWHACSPSRHDDDWQATIKNISLQAENSMDSLCTFICQLQKHQCVVEVAAWGAATLANTATISAESRTQIVTRGGISTIIGLLCLHPHDIRVQCQGHVALAYLTMEHADSVANQGGMEMLMSSMLSHPIELADVGCKALANLVQSAPNRELAKAANIPDQLSYLVRSLPSDFVNRDEISSRATQIWELIMWS